MVSIDDGDTVQPPLSITRGMDPGRMVLTFDDLLQRSHFVPMLKTILNRLSAHYQLPVDVEFAVSVAVEGGRPRFVFHLLQCRPQNLWQTGEQAIHPVPPDLAAGDTLFVCTRMVPQGRLSRIDYVLFVDPEAYRQLKTPQDFFDVARTIGQLNKALEGRGFIMIGPGRWGSSDFIQGVPVTYADIFNARALVELTSQTRGYSAEPSYGTHFFQDLVETQIYPLAVYPDEPEDYLNLDFLTGAENHLAALLPAAPEAGRCIRVIHVPTQRPGYQLELAMDGERGVAYLARTGA
jgi:hypothetical protein